ncbi:hypothetical protein [Thermomonospora umbrina]|uniref:Uncharacterized protein n=1 Tax=Thermomonospora umbrina TaxID=111806 RepID=A0A3D9T544_9ACTN|nr:hypothetical protein [Thermomonospora umbrina]REF00366.1 hypothetical protein DFJ69_5898 [Thermomonospora umbrina]
MDTPHYDRRTWVKIWMRSAALTALIIGVGLIMMSARDGYTFAHTAFAVLAVAVICIYAIGAELIIRMVMETSWTVQDRTITRVEASMQVALQALDKIKANPATAAQAELALDELRTVWGDEADHWLGKSSLN